MSVLFADWYQRTTKKCTSIIEWIYLVDTISILQVFCWYLYYLRYVLRERKKLIIKILVLKINITHKYNKIQAKK